MSIDSTNPKDGPIWKSRKYKDWLIRQDCMYCHGKLYDEYVEGKHTPHHHRKSGGVRPRDYMMLCMCARCHTELHADEKNFLVRRDLTNGMLDRHMVMVQFSYIESLVGMNPIINNLSRLLEEASDGS